MCNAKTAAIYKNSRGYLALGLDPVPGAQNAFIICHLFPKSRMVLSIMQGLKFAARIILLAVAYSNYPAYDNERRMC